MTGRGFSTWSSPPGRWRQHRAASVMSCPFGAGERWWGCSIRRRGRLDGTSPPRDWLHADLVGARQTYTIESRGSPGTRPSCAGPGPLLVGEGGASAAPRLSWSGALGEPCGVVRAPAVSDRLRVKKVPCSVAAFERRACRHGQMSFPPSRAPHRPAGGRKRPCGPGAETPNREGALLASLMGNKHGVGSPSCPDARLVFLRSLLKR